MTYDLKAFFDAVRRPLFFGTLPRWQSEPMERIIEEGVRRGRITPDIAYVLATAYHETGRWKYRREIGQGAGRDYGERVLVWRGHREAYFGRGDSQLTWLGNYARMSVRLTLEMGREIDLVNNPSLAETPEISALVLWEGMVDGLFTGHNLADYIRPEQIDYVGARAIVNGTDQALKIAGHATAFHTALLSAQAGPAATLS